MHSDHQTADFYRIIAGELPLIDVRAPAEFKVGSVPGAENIGLLDDEERHRVGLTYREEGKDEAFRLADRLLEGAGREHRIQAWCSYLESYPDSLVYCARGGMRSKTAARWIYEKCGRDVPRLEGGYKAMRNYLLGRLDPAEVKSRPVLLGGRTGSGKTRLLRTLAHSIDLEALANHRGSTFGRFTTPQPGQADFENRLAAALVRHDWQNHSHLILEDEGRHVGKRFLPKDLSHFFNSGDLAVLSVDFEERVENIYQEYVLESQQLHLDQIGNGDSVAQRWLWQWFEEMRNNLRRIAKRLGPENFAEVASLLESGCLHQERSGDPQAHKRWIHLLLRHYYDPMYDYQLKKRGKTPLLVGDLKSVSSYLGALAR